MNKITVCALVTVSLFSGTSVFAQVAATDSATASTTAEIVSVLAIEKVEDLDFGKILQPTTPQVAVVSSGGATDGSTVSYHTPPTPASFSVEGPAGEVLDIAVTDTYDITHTDGSTTMVVSDIETGGQTVTLSATGTGTVNVGGKLTVGAAQATGIYSNPSDLQVTVSY